MTPMNHTFALQQTAQELRDQIRTSVQEQIRTAQQQGQTSGGPFVIVTKDGNATIQGAIPPGTPGTSVVPVRDLVRNLDVPPRAHSLMIAFIVIMGAVIIFRPIAGAIGRMIDRRSERPQVPTQLTAQLTQLTQAVDSIAIEVERISEGQRFTTKLLSEQQKAAKSLPSS